MLLARSRLNKRFYYNEKLQYFFHLLSTHCDHPIIYHLKCKNCEVDYIGISKRIWTHRMNEHEKTDENSHVYEHHHEDGHEIDFENVEILDRADSLKKLEYKEMLYIRKLKPTLNKQVESELFTLIIRNVQLDNSITRDAQKYLNKNKK